MNATLTLDSEVWATAKTGMIGHVFLGDFDSMGYLSAACRSTIERSGSTVFHKRARFVKVCATCATAFVNAVRDAQSAAAKDPATEVAVAACARRTGRTVPVAEEGPCCEHATMYHGARGCSECGCTAPRSSMSAHGGAAPAEVDPAAAAEEAAEVAADRIVSREYPNATAYEPVHGRSGALLGFTFRANKRFGWVTLAGTYSRGLEPYRSTAAELVGYAAQDEGARAAREEAPAEETAPAPRRTLTPGMHVTTTRGPGVIGDRAGVIPEGQTGAGMSWVTVELDPVPGRSRGGTAHVFTDDITVDPGPEGDVQYVPTLTNDQFLFLHHLAQGVQINDAGARVGLADHAIPGYLRTVEAAVGARTAWEAVAKCAARMAYARAYAVAASHDADGEVARVLADLARETNIRI